MTEYKMQDILYDMLNDERHHKFILPNVKCLFPSSLHGWECDLISVTNGGFINEYEIKISHVDFKADTKKGKHFYLKNKLKHYNIPTYFWYVIHGFELGIADIPEYAGLMQVGLSKVRQIKRAPRLNWVQITNDQKEALYKAAYLRYWNIRLKVGGNPC